MSVFPGEVACVSAAALWAIAVALFRGPIAAHGARAVNLAKCALALVLLGITALAAGKAGDLLIAPGSDLALVALSGVVGLTLGDTALFAAVRRIGPYRTLLFQNLAPAFTALTAFVWLGRLPAPRSAVGAVVTLAGVALVLSPDRSDRRPRAGASGIVLAVAAAAGQGIGIVLAKEGMDSLSEISAAFLRLAAATVGLVALVGLAGLRGARALARDRSAAPRVAVGTALGTYFAFFLMMVGIARAPETVAAVLLSTTPVFSLFVDARLGREKITARALVGTALAIAGVVLLSSG